MEKTTTDSASISVLNGQGGAKRPAGRDLRLEVLDLRLRLKLSEEALARHTIMLREGDHRIKNSLQLVASLMRLQARNVEASLDAIAAVFGDFPLAEQRHSAAIMLAAGND